MVREEKWKWDAFTEYFLISGRGRNRKRDKPTEKEKKTERQTHRQAALQVHRTTGALNEISNLSQMGKQKSGLKDKLTN